MTQTNQKITFLLTLSIALFAFAGSVLAAPPAECDEDATTVPGHCAKTSGTVIGNYYSVYAYDDNGLWYWNLGDGRVYGNASSIEELDVETLTQCDYRIHYKGDFGDDPFLDTGVIQNMINCHGYDDNGTYNYFIVNEDDKRYTGNPDLAIWGTWEYHVSTEWKKGNLARPQKEI